MAFRQSAWSETSHHCRGWYNLSPTKLEHRLSSGPLSLPPFTFPSSLSFLCRGVAPLAGTPPPSTRQVTPSRRPVGSWSPSPSPSSSPPSRCAVSSLLIAGVQSGRVAAAAWSCPLPSTRDASTVAMLSVAAGEVPSRCRSRPWPALPVGSPVGRQPPWVRALCAPRSAKRHRVAGP
jgi:hypothetical protein